MKKTDRNAAMNNLDKEFALDDDRGSSVKIRTAVFKVEVVEKLRRVVLVAAADSQDAIERVEEMLDKEEIVLDADDFADREIQIAEEL